MELGAKLMLQTHGECTRLVQTSCERCPRRFVLLGRFEMRLSSLLLFISTVNWMVCFRLRAAARSGICFVLGAGC